VFDKEVCGDLGKYGAHCAHTLTDETRDIPKQEWDRVRIGYLCVSSEGFNDTETALDQLCQTTNLCNYETREQLREALRRVRGVVERSRGGR